VSVTDSIAKKGFEEEVEAQLEEWAGITLVIEEPVVGPYQADLATIEGPAHRTEWRKSRSRLRVVRVPRLTDRAGGL
jgi:hypothetical protein